MTEEVEVIDPETKTKQEETDNTSKKQKKPKSKARKIVEWILFGLFGVLFAIVLAGNISAMIHKDENYQQSLRFGLGSFVILTNSMEPEYPVGNAIITYKDSADNIYQDYLNGNQTIDLTFVNIEVGIDFTPETPRFRPENGGQRVVSNQIMTHRLIEMHIDETVAYGEGRYIFITSGINSEGELSKEGQYQLFTEKQCLGKVIVNSSFLGGLFSFVGSALGLLVLLLIPAIYLIITSGIDIYKALQEKEDAEEAVANGSSDGGKLDGLSQKERERLKQELLEEMLNNKNKNNEK